MARKKKASDTKTQDRPIASNRRAFYNYEILDRYEAGLVLKGTEIKSLRAGRADLRDGYARPQNGELWLVNTYIAPYDPASIYNHDPRRPRKLLMHREQIDKLKSLVAEKRLTIVPLRLYIKNHVAKVELGLAQGKRQYDKRRAIMEKELDKAARRSMRSMR
ncbi:MAG: SsrA-binding protein SmpB [Dehalococcoidia bacterium]|nr:SsrA-binding protein SmpB [Dehalococcoidia bacterium]MDP6227410.1 SsrA-binding protein SmpB [Dehalococcoidia bacterium]MDP7084211.1 SsrA-binding protein SmpB [Dehalococcoidia bacterium]MDP7201863.1 SsrA-binding protein SmpB [Dehalococcoidia bacterium]MDP7510642.1 SsrA-binding protein SmpB [Dehalococcoidia bacterium]